MTVWPTEPNILTIWPLIENVCFSLVKVREESLKLITKSEAQVLGLLDDSSHRRAIWSSELDT